ncbi:hypothetical protein GCM10023191_021590 [Actinoallomurus oryzae]|uniref:beta-N-acetylhexosaminidase n=1 Tax=Actinoallomurus oryzae TaxID=502180 RepID=A0ABP8PR91_9ACTN
MVALVTLAGLTGVPAAAVADAASPPPAVVPALRSWNGGAGTFSLRPGSRVVVDAAHAADLRDDARTFAADLAAAGAERLPVVTGHRPGHGDVFLTEHAGDSAEAYELTVGTGDVTISGGGAAGVFYGEQSVEQILKTAEDHATLPAGSARERPAQPERGLMIDTAREYWPVATLLNTIRQMAWMKLNTFHWHVTDSEAFRLRLPGYAGLAAARSYTPEDVRRIEAYARRYHVAVVPEMDIPGHATSLTAYRPPLRWDCASMNQIIHAGRIDPGFTVDITKQANVAWLDGLTEAFLSVFDAPVVHLGGDETPDADLQSRCPELAAYAKSRGYAKTEDVFLAYENHLDDLVRRHGRTMEIWGWWPQTGGGASVTVDKDVRIQAWLGDEATFLAQGYQVLVSNEHSRLYVVPKDPPGTGNGNYIPDDAALYGAYAPPSSPQVEGMQMAEWGDNAYAMPAAYFAHYLRRPMQILASSAWNGPRDGGHLDYELTADRVGSAPGVPETGDPDATVVDGTPYGADDAAAAFDGDPATAFTGQTAGIDLGAGRDTSVSEVRLLPRSNRTADLSALVGGRIQGCVTGPDTGCRDLARVRWTPTMDWLTLPVDDGSRYRWLRYAGPPGSTGAVAEIQFLTRRAGALQVRVRAPARLSPDRPTTATVTLTNDSDRTVDRVSLRVTADGQADQGRLDGRPRAVPGRIGPGRTVAVPVTLPTGHAAAGDYRVSADVAYRRGAGTAERFTARATAVGTVPFTTFAQAFDNIGTTDDANPQRGGVDGAMSSFSRQDLASAGAVAGRTLTAGGFRYTWPDTAAGEPDNAVAHGQVIPVSGRPARIGVLATATYAPPGGLTGTGTVTYTDGTTTPYTITVPDWSADAPVGVVLAVHGTKVNGFARAQAGRTANVFSFAVPVAAGKRPASITLPAGPAWAAGKTPAIHVFALSTRSG